MDGAYGKDKWFYLIATIATSGSPTNLGLFVDGEVVAMEEPSPLQAGYPPDTTTYMKIGRRGSGAGPYFGGRMGIISIYNRVLTPAEAKQNYDATKWRFQ